MKFSSLTLIVTDDCNFKCSYCRLGKEKKYMPMPVIEKALSFFYPYLGEGACINFFGGEPLLAFNRIKHAVQHLNDLTKGEKKKIKYYITTNGSLLNDNILNFFESHGFGVILSFDGIIQEFTRKQGSAVPIRQLFRHVEDGMYPGINFSTNSTFSPAMVNDLSSSLQYIIEAGMTEVQFSLSNSETWDEKALLKLEKELAVLTDFLISYYREKRKIPLVNFRVPDTAPKNKTTFSCAGGKKRMAIGPDGDIWGCSYFHGYLKDRKDHPKFHNYFFGKLDDFIKNYNTVYPQVLYNYKLLRQECFFAGHAFCYLCENVQGCSVCPIDVAYTTSVIGKIPTWMCRINRILRKENDRFLGKLKNEMSVSHG
jgi:sulfatase maturation enzyme AslB (radical SAM superfamily)